MRSWAPRVRPVTSVPRARLARGRFPLVTSVPRSPSRSGAVSACHERFCMSQASPAPVSLGGGFGLSRAFSLGGGFGLSRVSPAPVSLGGGFGLSRACVPRARLARGRFPRVPSVHRASLARGRFPHVTSVHRASLARGRFPHVPSVHRASLARGRLPPVSARLAWGRFPLVSRTQLHTAVPPASLVRPVCTPSRHRTPGLQHNEMEIPSYLRRHSLYRSQAP